MTAPMDTGGTTASMTMVSLAEMYTIAATVVSCDQRASERRGMNLPPTTADMIALCEE